jgi:sugar transferase (PEP-CTERM/EpsH1 system associated)
MRAGPVQDLLFLAHRVPYPPDKGDKIRSWNLLRHLARKYRVHLGCFADTLEDLHHDEALRPLCAGLRVVALDPGRARLRSLAGLATGEALTLGYYRDRALAGWVRELLAAGRVSRVLAFSSSMAPYAMGPRAAGVRRVFDFVDVDSDKWRQYAERKPFPASMIYSREAKRLLDFERSASAASDATIFVSDAEATLFRSLAPESAGRIHVVPNGVDFEFFNPDGPYVSPFPPRAVPLVFTGAMDYWANVDAVSWFAREILPLVSKRRADAGFWIVGANPAPAVRELASLQSVTVTGRVPDVRPYLAHAAAVVAPLRLARGVQNKVLEAMAMAQRVVASPEAAEGIDAVAERDLVVAGGTEAFADAVCGALDGQWAGMGERARATVMARYGWDSALAGLENLFEADTPSVSMAR